MVNVCSKKYVSFHIVSLYSDFRYVKLRFGRLM